MLSADKVSHVNPSRPSSISSSSFGKRDENGNIHTSSKNSSSLNSDTSSRGAGTCVQPGCTTSQRTSGEDTSEQEDDPFGKDLRKGTNGRNIDLMRKRVQSSNEDRSHSRKTLERKRSSSCIAMKTAFSDLYRSDDFWKTKIAAGFFSTVYKVKHRTTGELMVMKMSQHTNTWANNLHEIELLNQLCHVNILRFIGVCIDEGHLHALTEFVNGGILQDLLCDEREYLSWPVRQKLANDIAEGMKYLHSKGFMHRDLTSENILIRRKLLDLECVIADLGLAIKIPRSRNEKLPVVGSTFWISPECLHGEYYDEKNDVFSFGIIMCQIIARVSGDPEELPRTTEFGVNEAAFQLLVGNCPQDMINVAFLCCKLTPKERPSFNSIVKSLCAMNTSYISNVAKSLSCSDAGQTMSQRKCSRTLTWSISSLPSTKSRKGLLVRSNSDSGSRKVNIQRVSEKINPFCLPHFSEKKIRISDWEQNDNRDSTLQILSPTAKLCNELASGWPEMEDDCSFQVKRSTSMPSINASPACHTRQLYEGSPSSTDIHCSFDLHEKLLRSPMDLPLERLTFQDAL